MTEVLNNNRLPSEVGASDTYNRLQMGRAVLSRGDPTAETSIVSDRESLRVLVVDDHRANADILSSLVRVWGHDTQRAYDGTSGLALAATYQPDVLLLDIVMPRMSGLELARQVRQVAGLNGCFLVAITGRTDPGCVQQCEEAGVDLFLIKPVCPSILKALLSWELEYVSRSRQVAARDLLTVSFNECGRTMPSHADDPISI